MTTAAATAEPSPGEAQPEKAPLQWRLLAIAIPVMALGFGGAALIGEAKNGLGAALIAMFTVIAAVASPREKLWRGAAIVGASTFAMLILATATIQTPVLAGLSMFLVAFLGTIIGTAGQALSVAGILVSMAYLIPAATGIARSISVAKAAELGLAGLVAAAIAIGAILAITAIKGEPADGPAGEDDGGAAQESQAPAPSVREQVRAAMTFRDATFRYALRRGLALGIAMGVYAATENHDVFWIMLTIFIVLQPDPASSWHKALSRSAGVMIGAVLVAGLGQFLPAEAIIGLGVLTLCAGLVWMQRSYTVFAAGISFLVVAIFGASQNQFVNWAALRIVDTLIGAAIALLVGYILFPDRRWDGKPEAAVSGPDSPSGS